MMTQHPGASAARQCSPSSTVSIPSLGSAGIAALAPEAFTVTALDAEGASLFGTNPAGELALSIFTAGPEAWVVAGWAVASQLRPVNCVQHSSALLTPAIEPRCIPGLQSTERPCLPVRAAPSSALWQSHMGVAGRLAGSAGIRAGLVMG